MDEKTKEQIQQIFTVLLGVPNTDDKGMAGLCRKMEKHLAELNGKVNTNTTWRKAMCWVMGIITTGVVAYLIAL